MKPDNNERMSYAEELVRMNMLEKVNPPYSPTDIIVDPKYNRPDDPVILNYKLADKFKSYLEETLYLIKDDPIFELAGFVYRIQTIMVTYFDKIKEDMIGKPLVVGEEVPFSEIVKKHLKTPKHLDNLTEVLLNVVLTEFEPG